MAKKRTHPDWFDENGKPIETEGTVGENETRAYPGGVKTEYNFSTEDSDERLVTDGGVASHRNYDHQGERSPDDWASIFGFSSADDLYRDLLEYKEREGDGFGVEEFKQENDVNGNGNFGKALAAIGNFNEYDIHLSLESDGSRSVKIE